MTSTVLSDLQFIYFDLDDTLLDHKAAEKASLLRCRDQLPVFSAINADLLVSTYRTLNKQLWHEYGVGQIDRATLSQRRFEGTLQQLDLDADDAESFGLLYMSIYRHHWSWVPGARQTWEKVRAQWPAGIITNGFTETQKEKFKRFGFDLSADSLVISEEIGFMKPDPGIFDYAARQAGVRPDQILYVGDSPGSDIHGAAHAGYRTAWFVRDEYPNAHEVPADYTFTDFSSFDTWLGID